jgi:hypothetical protein
VDFGSKDGLREWVIDSFQSELDSGYLKYYYTEELPHWHASIAKNTAHLCATGNILVNLDCDNYTGPWGGADLMKTFAVLGNRCIVHQFSGKNRDGSYGRIAVANEYFKMIGGYDESFDPMAFQDNDLIDRLMKLGLKYVSYSGDLHNRAIPNTKEEGIAQTNLSKSYMQMLDSNYRKTRLNLSEGRLIANNGKFGINEGLFDHHGKSFHPLYDT